MNYGIQPMPMLKRRRFFSLDVRWRFIAIGIAACLLWEVYSYYAGC